MRIVQIIQRTQLRGAEMFACQLANHLVTLGHEVMVISLFENEPSPLPFKGEIICIRANAKLRYYDIGGWKRLGERIRDFNADVVQANAADTLKYAVLSKLVFRWRGAIVFRNASTLSQYLRNRFIKAFNNFLLSRVDLVISVSHHSRYDLLRLYPWLEDKCIVIPVGIELDALPPKAESKTEYILHVGGFTFEKNHTGLLQIAEPILKANKSLELWLAGDGPLRPAITQLALKMGLDQQIKFLGFRSDILNLMVGAKMLVLPSILEGLPGVILEAMYCKTPVVAFKVGGIGEVIKDGGTGWLAKAGSVEEFREGMVQILSSEETVTRVTETAFSLVKKEYSNGTLAKEFVNQYQTIVC